MIPKGNQRGGGLQLAAHLQNTFDNDRVEVADLRGAISPELAGAFSEWQAQAKGTKGKKYLYSLSLNPDQRQGRLTREQYMDFIARAEITLKLQDQPRAVVFHVKHGREHCHVVWSRIDTAKMRAIPMSHDHQKLRRVAQEFAKDHNLELPQAMKKDRGSARFEEQKSIADLGEKQQEERSGIDKTERMALIKEAWTTTKTGDEFMKALAAKDYFIARGDRRGYVVVDLAGEVHSLSRQIKGAKAAEIKKRLAAVSPEQLPGIERAQEHAALIRDTRIRARAAEMQIVQGPTPEQRRTALQQEQSNRRRPIEVEREAIRLRHAREAGKLAIGHASVNASIAKNRGANGLFKMMFRLPGINRVVTKVVEQRDAQRRILQKAEMSGLRKLHIAEIGDVDRRLAALLRIDRRESKSLETTMRREAFQRIAGVGKTRDSAGRDGVRPANKTAPVIPSKALREMFDQAARARGATPDREAGRAGQLKETFNRHAAERPEATGELTSEPTKVSAEPSLRDAFAAAADARDGQAPEKTDNAESKGDLSDQFNRAADQRDRAMDGPQRDFDKHYSRKPADKSIRR